MKLLIVILLLISFFIGNAQTAPNKMDEKGMKQGYWIKTNSKTGKIIYKGIFKDDKPVGVFKYYYTEIDTIHTIMDFRNAGKIAYAQVFYMTGKKQAQGKYINEKKDSVWTFYDESGKRLSIEGYKEGMREGKSIIYYPNGEISDEKNYKNDLKNGVFKQYFDDKKLKAEGSYINDKLVGKNAYYYPNGIPAAMGYYNDKGDRNGVWLYKDKDGKVTSKDVYDNGKLLNEKEAAIWLAKNKGKEPKEEQKKENKPSKGNSKAPTKGVKK